jgi:TonB family protein
VREDRVFGEGLAASLEGSGLAVVRCENEFDYNNPAPCVLILWSAVSTRSGTLRDIASRAQREGRLVSAKVDGCEPPPGLAARPPFDLGRWSGDPDDQEVDPVFFAVDRMVASRARRQHGGPAPAQAAEPPSGPHLVPQAPRPAPPPADISGSMRSDLSIPPTYTPIGRRPPPPPAEPVRAGPVGGRPPAPLAPPTAPNLAEEALAWRRIEHSNDPTDYLNFLSEFGPEGTFAELAQFKLDKLTAARGKAASFMQHTPSPHQAPPAKPKPAPRLPEPRDAPRDAAPWREAEREHTREYDRDLREPPRMREEQPRMREAPPRPRAPEPEPFHEPARPKRTASGRPRRRVPVDQALDDHPPVRIERSSGGGGAFRTLVLVALLAGGGFAFYKFSGQQQPGGAPSPEEVADAQRAGPLADPSAPPSDSGMLATSYDASRQSLTATPASSRNAPVARGSQNVPPQQPQRRVDPTQNGAAPMPPISYRPPSNDVPPQPTFTPPPVAAPEPTPQPTPAPASPPTPVDDGYRQLIWLQRPTGADLAALFPTNAAQRGVGGQVVLDCGVLPTGRLDCRVASESPPSSGFGRAALAAAKKFQAAAKAVDGRDAIGKRTRLPIKFQSLPPEP